MSKHAVSGLTRTLGLDGRDYDIACAQIDIGNALTDIAAGFTKAVPQADGEIRVEPVMDVDQVAAMVLHMASLPRGVNTPFVTIMPRDMPYIGRGKARYSAKRRGRLARSCATRRSPSA